MEEKIKREAGIDYAALTQAGFSVVLQTLLSHDHLWCRQDGTVFSFFLQVAGRRVLMKYLAAFQRATC